jgi:hypothetical protein
MQSIEESVYIKRLAVVLAHLASLRGSVPGSVSASLCRSLLFPDAECLIFGQVQAMERWFRSPLITLTSPLTDPSEATTQDPCAHCREADTDEIYILVPPMLLFPQEWPELFQREQGTCLEV